MNIHNVLIKSSLLYGSETWRLTENNKRRVEATEMDALRKSSRISRKERIRIFTFAPCMLLHLFYLKPTHALFCKIHSHSHLKLQTVKNVCETHN